MKLVPATLLLLAASSAKAQTVCTSTADCAQGMEYCAGGVCAAMGACAMRDDCFNPNNGPYPLAACVGLVDCIDGQCGITCGEETCPDGQVPAVCEPGNLPCDNTEPCAAADTCSNDFCGEECTAKFFDAAGNVVDCSEPVATQLPASTEDPVATQLPAMPDQCASDADCVDVLENGEPAYCSSGSCVQMGFCNKDNDCKNPSNVYAVAACVGVISCTDGQCAIECGPSFCPEGVDEVTCETDPCLDFKFGCMAAQSCVANTCGECSPLFFNPAGYELPDCVPASTEPPVATQLPAMDQCASDADCVDFSENGAYCNAGQCRENGFCSTDNDCKNPSNQFAMIECVGVLSCAEGQCSVECGGSFCPEGVEQVTCETDPCLDFKFGCPAASSCAVNSCGECSAILFDEAGFDLGDCMPAAEFATDPCMSDMDCGEDQYCGDGVCLNMGECTQRIDCWNPANIYGIAMCVGLIDCMDGPNATMVCGIECGPQECPGGEERTPCPEPSTCNVTNCEEAVSCNFDGCGGSCTEVYFDEAGTQVCVEESSTCSADADCNPVAEARQAVGEGSYCAQGVCMEKGACMTDLDCLNPSNERPIPACVGYSSCDMGQCAWTCGPQCPDGAAWSVCEVEPCANTTCAAATSCVNDYCSGGCDTVFFDAAGNEVTDCDPATATFNSGNSAAPSMFSALFAFAMLALSAMHYV